MKKTLALYEFENEVRKAGRYAQFGGAPGCALLFNYINHLEDVLGVEVEMDLAAFAGDFEVVVEGGAVTLYDLEGVELGRTELEVEAE